MPKHNPDTAIPEEIMREARKIAECHLRPGSLGCDILEGSIARALMARDQRAADIARKLGADSDHSHGYEVACEDVAAAILTYSAKEGQPA
ncbi:hypothetical protein GCM10011491_30300 [Brucella endophytica]|uniref:Uncharacterized protein n=1 Tax=Brucella endophytica TaxID=1963359 RepID=A0A916SH66_9HYPH|nr:hypothetical protein [Brucella endophytica]GGA99995.1 hypothetical protein GCM10011491_30300 [Brucella endophytica]